MLDGKRKVTVWIDPDVTRKAKGYAREHEVSLDETVEEALREKVGDGEYPTFAEYWRTKWAGRSPSDEELLAASDEPRYQHLVRKYLDIDSGEHAAD